MDTTSDVPARADADEAARGQVAAPAAEVYERFFVPALFGQHAAPLVAAAGVRAGQRVLDVGCGTGVVARAAAEAAGSGGEVAGLDSNEGMLAVARRHGADVAWHHGRAEDLPFADGSFDRVLSQFVLMFLEDPAIALGEARRVLRPGGRLAVSTWAGLDETPGYAAMVGLVDRIVGPQAADALRAPFTIGTAVELEAIVGPSFGEVEVARVEGTARFASIDDWVHTDVRGWTLADMVDDATFERLRAAARRELAHHTDAEGRVAFPAPALVAVGRLPA